MASRFDEMNVGYVAELGLHMGLDARIRVQNEPDKRPVGKLANCGCDGVESFAPTLSTVTGDDDCRDPALVHGWRWQFRFGDHERIDRRVAGNVNLSRDILCSKIRRGRRGWREQ